MSFQYLAEEAFGRPAIAPWLDPDVDDVTVLVDGRPEILLATLNVHEEFVQVPGVPQPSMSALEPTGVRRTERPTPLSDRLVGHSDAPLGREIFGISAAQTEPVIKPDRVTDDRVGIGSRDS
jgi:hypothetical protein